LIASTFSEEIEKRNDGRYNNMMWTYGVELGTSLFSTLFWLELFLGEKNSILLLKR